MKVSEFRKILKSVFLDGIIEAPRITIKNNRLESIFFSQFGDVRAIITANSKALQKVELDGVFFIEELIKALSKHKGRELLLIENDLSPNTLRITNSGKTLYHRFLTPWCYKDNRKISIVTNYDFEAIFDKLDFDKSALCNKPYFFTLSEFGGHKVIHLYGKSKCGELLCPYKINVGKDNDPTLGFKIYNSIAFAKILIVHRQKINSAIFKISTKVCLK